MSCTLNLPASLLTGVMLLSGCQMPQAEAQPARLTNMSPGVKAELQLAIVELIGGEPARLADNAFANSHQLFIEQAVSRDQQGRPMHGRHQQPAILLELQQRNNQCLLSHPASGRTVPLAASGCVITTAE